MPRKKMFDDTIKIKKEPPAIDPDAREQQLIAMATELAAEQIRNGTASSQVITHFLKLGSSRERLEKEILKKQEALYDAKTKAYESAEDIKELYAKAISAIQCYGGHADPEDYDESD